METSSSFYIHGSSTEEQGRLSLMNDLLNERCLNELQLSGGERILDVGCGTGQLTRMMAKAAGAAGKVVGIERDAGQLAEAKRLAIDAGEATLVEFRSGDAANLALNDGEWGSFDLAHTRFLLEHLPDPESVVVNMMRAVRPGGRVVLADDDHDNFRPWPEPDGFAELWGAYVRSYVVGGNDPFVGRRLVEILHGAGAVGVRNATVFFGGCKGNRQFDAVAENLIRVIGGARESMVASGLIDADIFSLGMEGLRRWRAHPSATLWYYVCWVEGYKAAG